MNMPQSDTSHLAAKLRLTCEMNQFGIEMYRAKLRRDDPSASDATLSDRVRRWLETPPEIDPPFRLVHRLKPQES